MKVKYLLVMFLFVVFIPFVYSYDCSNIKITQISKEAVCDGSSFDIEVSTKNNWNGVDTIRVFGSRGINFNTFPEIKLNENSKNNIEFKILCNNVENGSIDFLFYENEIFLCKKELSLENLYLPIKNSNNETLILPIEDVKKIRNITDKNDNTFFKWLFISFGMIILFFILIKFINYLSNRQ